MVQGAFAQWPFIHCGRIIKEYFCNDGKGASKVHPYQKYIEQYNTVYDFSKEVWI